VERMDSAFGPSHKKRRAIAVDQHTVLGKEEGKVRSEGG